MPIGAPFLQKCVEPHSLIIFEYKWFCAPNQNEKINFRVLETEATEAATDEITPPPEEASTEGVTVPIGRSYIMHMFHYVSQFP